MIMKKNLLTAAVVFSLGMISMSANAAVINFSGKVVNETCKLSEMEDLNLSMSPVGVDSLLAADAAATGVVTSVVAAVKCDNASAAGKVTMALMPIPGTTDGMVLKNKDGTATGVGFVVVGDDNTAFDFSKGSAEITADMTASGEANIRIAATYALDGTKVNAGTVNAVLPFVMTYN